MNRLRRGGGNDTGHNAGPPGNVCSVVFVAAAWLGAASLLAGQALISSGKDGADFKNEVSGPEAQPASALPSGALRFTLQPASQDVRLGSNAVFRAAVESDGAVAYQWVRNGTALPGAVEATLVFSNAQYSDTGFYTVEVNDGEQRLVSDTASLLVTATDPLDTWHTRFMGQTAAYLYDVTYAAGQFVAVGDAGTILTSSNGLDWIRRSSGTTNSLQGVNSGGGLIVAVGYGGTVVTSADGVVWAARTAAVNQVLYDVAYGNSLFVAAGPMLLTSADGLVWTNRAVLPLGPMVAIAYGNDLFVATGAAETAYTSMNGRDWNRVSTGRNAILDLMWDGQRFVGAGADGVLTSTNGTDWMQIYQQFFGFRCVAKGLGRLVAAEGLDIISTSDGTHWVKHTRQTGGFEAIAYGSGTFVAVGGGGLIRQSDPLVPEWPMITAPPTNQVVRLGQGFTNTVIASGSPLLSYQWRRNGMDLLGATNTTFAVTNSSLADSGDYSIVVANPLGMVTSLVASVRVGEPPTVLSGPVSQSIVRGGSVTLSCVATGTAPLGFRWVRNGQLAGFEETDRELSFFTLTNVQRTNAIRVAVTNAWSPAAFSALVKIIPLEDTDGDGLPDEWEERHGLRPDDPSDAALDPDHDGASNLAEYQAGTDCQDSRSVLRLQIHFTPSLTLSFEAISNQTYTVQYTDTLDGQAWSRLADVAAEPTNRVEVLSDESHAGRTRFYRLTMPRQVP